MPLKARDRAARAVPSLLVASTVGLVRRRWTAAFKKDYAVHEVANRGALKWSIGTLRPDLLLLDDTVAAAADIGSLHSLSPQTHIIVCCAVPNHDDAVSALGAGARGYHRRDSELRLTRKAVEKVQAGEIWVTRGIIPPLLERLASSARTETPRDLAEAALDKLSPRERDTALLILYGANNKEIAGKLGITEATVKAHLTAIFRKLGVPDRLHLALFLSDRARERESKPR